MQNMYAALKIDSTIASLYHPFNVAIYLLIYSFAVTTKYQPRSPAGSEKQLPYQFEVLINLERWHAYIREGIYKTGKYCASHNAHLAQPMCKK